MSYRARDWIESMRHHPLCTMPSQQHTHDCVFWMTSDERNEYERQLAELEARLAARAATNERQVQQLAEQGNVTQ